MGIEQTGSIMPNPNEENNKIEKPWTLERAIAENNSHYFNDLLPQYEGSKLPGHIALEWAKKGYSTLIFENINKFEHIDAQALAEAAIRSSGSNDETVFKYWDTLIERGMDKEKIVDLLISKYEVVIKPEDFRKISGGENGEFVNRLVEKEGYKGDSVKEVFQYAEDESLRQAVADRLLERELFETIQKKLTKFTPAVQDYIKTKLSEVKK